MTVSPIRALYCHAAISPDSIAFIHGDDVWTYQRFTTEVYRASAALLAIGLCEGDRIALHMRNVPELAIAYFACFRIGAIAVPLNARLKAAELSRLLQRIEPVLYIGQADLYREIANIATSVLPSRARYVVGRGSKTPLTRSWSELLADASVVSLITEPDLDAPAVLIASSGATGEPKFVTHTLRTMAATAEIYCKSGGLDGHHIVINAAPMAHICGLATFTTSIWSGALTILVEQLDGDAVLDAIERHKGTWLVGLPFTLSELVERQRQRPRDVSSLQIPLAAGDACPERVQAEFARLFGTPLHNVWVATEVMGSLSYSMEQGPVGTVTEGAQIRLTNDDGAVVLQGDIGELSIRGPNVTIGYWHGPGDIKNATKDGWYQTGDLMRKDERGHLWFVSRKKDMIIHGGSKISPFEVEEALMKQPAVAAAAVAGIPDDLLGQRVVGFVQLSKSARGVRPEDILAGVRKLLANYKMPEWLEIVPGIPRNAVGKIDRKALLAMLSLQKKCARPARKSKDDAALAAESVRLSA